MNKNTKNNISGTINGQKISLTELNGKEIEANLSNISLSSFGGAALLREEEQYLALSHQLSSCITDNRVPYLVRHSIDEIIRTRLFQICLGYEDANDCNRLRKDPMLRTAVGGSGLDSELSSQSTMSRFENSVSDEDLLRIQEMFVTMFILSYEKAPAHIILDCDDTNVDTYGTQELTLFNSYYDSYCYLPLMVFEGHSGRLILPLLKPGRRNKTADVADTLKWLIMVLREAWPRTTIMVRGDSHFCSHELMDWICLETRNTLFITGISANNVLKENPVLKDLEERTAKEFSRYQKPIKRYCSFMYKAKSWILPQRIVAKVEYTEKGELNIRFVVTNIRSVDDKSLYETTYCKRGLDELYIRSFKEAVNGDRLSCHSFKANRLRIFLYAAAYILLHSIKMRALRNTALEYANLVTIRERLLLCAVSIRYLKTKIIIDYAMNNPMLKELKSALIFYERQRIAS